MARRDFIRGFSPFLPSFLSPFQRNERTNGFQKSIDHHPSCVRILSSSNRAIKGMEKREIVWEERSNLFATISRGSARSFSVSSEQRHVVGWRRKRRRKSKRSCETKVYGQANCHSSGLGRRTREGGERSEQKPGADNEAFYLLTLYLHSRETRQGIRVPDSRLPTCRSRVSRQQQPADKCKSLPFVPFVRSTHNNRDSPLQPTD